jgi:hypothetical protein
LESHALALGKTVATQAELKGPLQQRKLENLVDRVGQQVAEQLAPMLEQRFGNLPDNEAEAAILAVVDVLSDVDLSDEALLSADADAEVLARRIRRQFPKRAALLSYSPRWRAMSMRWTSLVPSPISRILASR